MKANLAIDIGASSGRHIVSYFENGKRILKEMFRFSNGVVEKNGQLMWDIDSLIQNVIKGIKLCDCEFEVEKIGVDTWGVDYVLLNANDEIIGDAIAYRDNGTEKYIDKVHDIVSFERLYELTGIQFQQFNTVYQLYRDKIEGKLENATSFLMIPDYINFVMTKIKRNELTNASTSGMLDVENGCWSDEIISKLDLKKELFGKLAKPSDVVGKCIFCKNATVFNVASHDTASAFEAVVGDDKLILSSGTWSLLGIKRAKPLNTTESRIENFTNESGVSYVRFLKNIMGMWLVNSVKKELNDEYSFAQLIEMSKQSKCDEIVDVSEARFLSPKRMLDEFENENIGDVLRVIYRSLAFCYAKAIRDIERITQKKYDVIEIVGGGVNNKYLNELTMQMSGKNVVEGESEATALGNIMILERSKI